MVSGLSSRRSELMVRIAYLRKVCGDYILASAMIMEP